jgi:Ser-tRNA(Ala) deacylase AlaX
MNADEEAFQKFHIDDVIGTTRFYMNNNFGMEPDTVYSFNTFQYNDKENLNEQAQERLEIIMKQMQEVEAITEELKAKDQLKWVRRMNSIRSRAEEIVLDELIYR